MKTDKWYLLMILPALAFICFFIFYPLARGGVMAFQNYNLFNLKDIRFIGLGNFRTIITSKSVSFWLILLNTLKWTVLSLILQFLLGFLLAMMLRKPFKGRSLYCGFVFYPWALCGFAIGLIWSWLLPEESAVFTYSTTWSSVIWAYRDDAPREQNSTAAISTNLFIWCVLSFAGVCKTYKDNAF